MKRFQPTLKLLAVGTFFLPTQTHAANLFGLINSVCISTVYPNMPNAKQVSDAGFMQLQAISAHPSGSWNTADQGWPTVFGWKGIRFRFREETTNLNGENLDGFVCEINEADEQIEDLKKEMFARYGEPQSSVLGDGYAEYYWSLSGVTGERREVVIDTMSNSMKYSSFRK